MNESEMFEAVLSKIVERYNLKIHFPDVVGEYFELWHNSELLGGMNPHGFNLLSNLSKLCDICETLLY